MLRLRPYKRCDAENIVSWIQDEEAFYKWSAGVLGSYPITAEDLNAHYDKMADSDSYYTMTAFDIMKVEKVTIGVFDNNPSAYHCYKKVGFTEMGEEFNKIYQMMGQDWKCIELEMA